MDFVDARFAVPPIESSRGAVVPAEATPSVKTDSFRLGRIHRAPRRHGGTAAWPLAARAQQAQRARRIGVLMGSDENDPLAKAVLSAFTQALAGLGWTEGRNVRMDVRWHGDDSSRIRALAQELVGLRPDIILTGGTPATVAVLRETRTIPIVFAGLADPVASGIVERLDRPSGNVTGFANTEASLGGRAAIMFNPDTAAVSTFEPFMRS
jgi:hypothetical protein